MTTNWFFSGLIFLIALFFSFLPELTRRDIFFAVTVLPHFRKTDKAKGILRRFRAAVWIHSVLALAIVLAGLATESVLLLLAGVFWQSAWAFRAFRCGRKRTMAHASQPSPRREVQLVQRPAGIFGHRLLQLGPFAIFAAVALYLRAHWNQIPERFPVHWGMNGEPDGWAVRSLLGVFGPWLVGFAAWGVIGLMAYATLHWSRQIRASGDAAENENRFRQTQLGILLGVEYLLTLVFSWTALMPLRAKPELPPLVLPFLLLGMLAFLFAVFAILVRTGQGGASLMRAGKDTEMVSAPGLPVGDRTPDRCWKAGLFYVNRDDPAVLVEKRFGIGYTLNLGNPRAWLLLAAIGVIPVVVALLSTRTH